MGNLMARTGTSSRPLADTMAPWTTGEVSRTPQGHCQSRSVTPEWHDATVIIALGAL
jgi:hypothetical protein